LWVWNNDTNSWIPDNYFNGFRLSGHCYDNYSGAENGYLVEIGLFISNYNTIKSTFQNCTYIVSGSHRADRYTSDLRTILYDLGMPTGYIDSDYIAAPEWILVGKPGLGSGNAYGWVYENYSTNPNQVAHLNFGLPIYGGSNNYLEFDGTDDYVVAPNTSLIHRTSNWSYSAWVNFSGTPGLGTIFENGSWGNCLLIRFETNCIAIYSMSAYWGFFSFSPTIGAWYKLDFVRNGNSINFYLNGSYSQSISFTADIQPSSNLFIGMSQHAAGQCFNGRISQTQIYNRALTPAEIQQNYISTKSRYGL
jgi:hypothetical protein